MNPPSYQQQTRDLIDALKAVCASNGLGNDGNEYKIIVQTFLYKLLCDKFAHEMKVADPKLAQATAVTTISTFHARLARRASTVARDGAWPGTTHASHARFMPAKSAMSAR